MPTLVVDVKHLDSVVRKFGVSPRTAELSVRATDHVDKLLGAQSGLGADGDEASLSHGQVLPDAVQGHFERYVCALEHEALEAFWRHERQPDPLDDLEDVTTPTSQVRHDPVHSGNENLMSKEES